ncbi:phosphotransferase family protein [Rhizobium leguminosarum]|uniref:choline/ethanolamine kinase family protein n=1 Tax=Rhizobium leguminosarum TaxID=384 RepID=UPI001C9594AA|nr:choline/ethanolamine kinase family protein [Rhizobium leguminosarum]MBY5760233.1 phosphotransferase family protein [Rhizobium leguminosarum]
MGEPVRRTLGKGESQAERAIEQAIAAVAEWQGRDVSYEPVPGGISNPNWRVYVVGAPHSFFVKIPGAGTEMFIDRRTANEAGRKAHAAGVGARIIDFFPETGVEVSEFVEGLRTSTNADFLDPIVRFNGLRALKAFNDSEPLSQRKTTFDMIDEHFRQVLDLGGEFPSDFGWLNARYREARSALEASGLDLAPCMNDTLAGNFLLDADRRVMLVDFEYASTNDRAAELALWFSEMCFSPEVEKEMIEEYYGRAEPALLARVSLFKALVDLKWSTWAMVQNEVSRLDFDFFKYGFWKHMRARFVMSDPQWAQWLKAV